MPKARRPLPRQLTKGAQQFERWRSQRKTRRIPEDLWALATKLGARHGVSRTARVLRVHYEGLKRRVEAAEALVAPQEPASFVEIRTAPTPSSPADRLDVEFLKTSGERMRIQLSAPGNLVELARLFIEGGR